MVGVRYVIAKFSRMCKLLHFLTHGAPLARFASKSSAMPSGRMLTGHEIYFHKFVQEKVFFVGYITNHLKTGPSGNIEILRKQNLTVSLGTNH